MRVVATDSMDGDYMLDVLLDLSLHRNDADEGGIDLESCLEYECKHDLDDANRPWRLNGRQAVMFTVSYIYEEG